MNEDALLAEEIACTESMETTQLSTEKEDQHTIADEENEGNRG